MTALRAVPLDELRRVASANTGLADVVSSLTELARKHPDDPELRNALLQQIKRILDGSEAINRAIQASVPVDD